MLSCCGEGIIGATLMHGRASRGNMDMSLLLNCVFPVRTIQTSAAYR